MPACVIGAECIVDWRFDRVAHTTQCSLELLCCIVILTYIAAEMSSFGLGICTKTQVEPGSGDVRSGVQLAKVQGRRCLRVAKVVSRQRCAMGVGMMRTRCPCKCREEPYCKKRLDVRGGDCNGRCPECMQYWLVIARHDSHARGLADSETRIGTEEPR